MALWSLLLLRLLLLVNIKKSQWYHYFPELIKRSNPIALQITITGLLLLNQRIHKASRLQRNIQRPLLQDAMVSLCTFDTLSQRLSLPRALS